MPHFILHFAGNLLIYVIQINVKPQISVYSYVSEGLF